MSVLEHVVSTSARRHTLDRRDAVERLLALAVHLPAPDRLLLEQVYRHGLSMQDVARLLHRPAWSVRRQVARLVRRLRHPLFKFLVLQGDLLDRPVRATARHLVFQGVSQRRAAALTGQSLHRVREHWRTLRVLARA